MFSIISYILLILTVKSKRIIPKKVDPYLLKIFYQIIHLFYISDNFYCPICQSYFRKFLSTPDRKNVICSKCGSFERHRLIWLFLKTKTNFFYDSLKVLHFAPLLYLQKISKKLPNLEYISVDLNSPLVMIKMDITNLLFKDNSFDVIICNHVLEHVNDDRKALKELFRVLKIGGWAIITCPIDYNRVTKFEEFSIRTPEERKIFYGDQDHLRIYGKDFKNYLETVGFIVNEIDYVKLIPKNLVKKMRLNQNDKIYYCFKQ